MVDENRAGSGNEGVTELYQTTATFDEDSIYSQLKTDSGVNNYLTECMQEINDFIMNSIYKNLFKNMNNNDKICK